MRERRAVLGVVVVVLVVVASACGGAGHSVAKPSGVSAMRDIKSERHVASTSTPTAAAAAPAVAPTPTTIVTTTTTAAAHVRAAAAPATAPATPPPPVSLPSVTVVAVQDGNAWTGNNRPCSNIDGQRLGPALLQVVRSGPSTSALTVSYRVTGTGGDYETLPGVVTIPPGADRAEISVVPAIPNGPEEIHVHRASPVSVSLEAGSGFAVGAPANATVTLHLDYDHYACPEGTR